MMKRKMLKTFSALLAFLMLLGMICMPTSAEETTLADKLAVYNLVAKSDADLAKLESLEYVNKNNNGYLQMTATANGAYPYFYFSADQVPADLTDYTYTIDMMCLTDEPQTNYVVYGVPTDTSKHGTVGVNPNNGQIKGNDWIKGTSLYMGQGDFSELVYGANIWHTYEITVKKTAEDATTVTVKVDGIALSDYTDAGYVLASSTVGVCLFKGKTVGIDNVKVVDNTTNNVVYQDDFSNYTVEDDEEDNAGDSGDDSGSTPVVPGTPVTSDPHAASGYGLLKYYNIVGGNSADFADGSGNPDVDPATKVQDGYLSITLGDPGATYTYVKFADSIIPKGLTNYTLKVDLIDLYKTGNSNVQVIYGAKAVSGGVEIQGFGHRTGANAIHDDSVEEQVHENWGKVLPQGSAVSISQDLIYGGDILSDSDIGLVESAARRTYEITVSKAEGANVSTVSLKIDGVDVSSYVTCNAELTALIGFYGVKTRPIGVDNIYVKDNTTGNVLVDLDFEDHSYGDTLHSIDDASHGYVCPCGAASVTEHTWNAGVEIDDATSCTTKKSMKYTCTGCNHEKIVANAHTPQQTVVEATCLEDGYVSTVCTTCNEVLEHTVIESMGHKFGPWEKVENGKKRTCTVCSLVEEDLVETTPVTEATTTNEKTPGTTEERGCKSMISGTMISMILIVGAATVAKKKRKS